MGKAKLLLQLDGKPLVRWSVEGLRPHVDRVIVVTPPDDTVLREALAGLDVGFVANAWAVYGEISASNDPERRKAKK